jgi:hypothetical protein
MKSMFHTSENPSNTSCKNFSLKHYYLAYMRNMGTGSELWYYNDTESLTNHKIDLLYFDPKKSEEYPKILDWFVSVIQLEKNEGFRTKRQRV